MTRTPNPDPKLFVYWGPFKTLNPELEPRTRTPTRNSKCDRNKQKYERISRILINVKSGVEHLADKLEPILIDVQPVVMSDNTVRFRKTIALHPTSCTRGPRPRGPKAWRSFNAKP